jgi:hypothetical protein
MITKTAHMAVLLRVAGVELIIASVIDPGEPSRPGASGQGRTFGGGSGALCVIIGGFWLCSVIMTRVQP